MDERNEYANELERVIESLQCEKAVKGDTLRSVLSLKRRSSRWSRTCRASPNADYKL